MASQKNIKTTAAVVIAMGYCCSLLVCQDQIPIIEHLTKDSTNESEPGKNITLEDLFISVKTTQHYQYTRLPIILKTWFQLAKEQTWFFTDIDNPRHQKETNGHMVNTKCPTSHNIVDLCCKMGFEIDYFLKTSKRWFCHFDDDNYVNVPRLVSLLQDYDYNLDWYLGRSWTRKPFSKRIKSQKYTFWYGIGGAGICLSRSLLLILLPFISDGKFKGLCDLVQFPDDLNLGFMINLVGSRLTNIPEFHSHAEQMKWLNPDLLKEQVSLSYNHNKTTNKWNTVSVPGFDTQYDPTRFLSLHCFLFPHFPICSNYPGLPASLLYPAPTSERPVQDETKRIYVLLTRRRTTTPYKKKARSKHFVYVTSNIADEI